MVKSQFLSHAYNFPNVPSLRQLSLREMNIFSVRWCTAFCGIVNKLSNGHEV